MCEAFIHKPRATGDVPSTNQLRKPNAGWHIPDDTILIFSGHEKVLRIREKLWYSTQTLQMHALFQSPAFMVWSPTIQDETRVLAKSHEFELRLTRETIAVEGSHIRSIQM